MLHTACRFAKLLAILALCATLPACPTTNPSAPYGGSAGGGSCSSNSSCSADAVCRAGACTSFSGLQYRLTIQSFGVAQKTPNGEAWDGFGGLPDPVVCVYRNSLKQFCTATASDSTAGDPWQSGTLTLSYGDELAFIIYDVDVSAHDTMASGKFTDLGATLHKGSGTAVLNDLNGDLDYAMTVTWSAEPL